MSRNLPSQFRSARACSAEYPIRGNGSSEVVPKSTTDTRITRTTSAERRINNLPWLLLKMTSAGLPEQAYVHSRQACRTAHYSLWPYERRNTSCHDMYSDLANREMVEQAVAPMNR